jgi:peptidoglycan/LPS O-acetylase OafA/YrhL
MSIAKDRIASLDGLRAVSIALVVFGHLSGTRGFPLGESPWFPPFATLGVRVFFVISGFLITGLLLSELEQTGSVHIGRFYFRRTLRIFVPYYAFLLTVIILGRFGVIAIPASELSAAATYTSNYRLHPSWELAHTWSLSVEEQFYLLWPAALWLLGRGRALALAGFVLLLVPGVRLALWQLYPAMRDGVGHRFEAVSDALAMGCLLAGVREWLHRPALYLRALRSPFFATVPMLVVASCPLDQHPRLAYALGWTAQNIGIAMVIDYCLRYPDSGMVKLLSTRALVFIGQISYSIYLWQQLFLNRWSSARWCAFPINLVAVGLCATVSYFAIERTSLALRRRMERRFFRTRIAPSTASAIVPLPVRTAGPASEQPPP